MGSDDRVGVISEEKETDTADGESRCEAFKLGRGGEERSEAFEDLFGFDSGMFTVNSGDDGDGGNISCCGRHYGESKY